jgi:hypothetical protein
MIHAGTGIVTASDPGQVIVPASTKYWRTPCMHLGGDLEIRDLHPPRT